MAKATWKLVFIVLACLVLLAVAYRTILSESCRAGYLHEYAQAHPEGVANWRIVRDGEGNPIKCGKE